MEAQYYGIHGPPSLVVEAEHQQRQTGFTMKSLRSIELAIPSTRVRLLLTAYVRAMSTSPRKAHDSGEAATYPLSVRRRSF